MAALAPWAAAAMAVVVAWMTGRANRRAKEVEAQESPYQALAERVVKLEAKVERLERERDDARTERDELRGERDAMQRKVIELESSRVANRDLVIALFGFIDAFGPADIVRPFRRPYWVDEDTLT